MSELDQTLRHLDYTVKYGYVNDIVIRFEVKKDFESNVLVRGTLRWDGQTRFEFNPDFSKGEFPYFYNSFVGDYEEFTRVTEVIGKVFDLAPKTRPKGF